MSNKSKNKYDSHKVKKKQIYSLKYNLGEKYKNRRIKRKNLNFKIKIINMKE